MKQAKIFGLLSARHISVSALLVCGLQSYGQRLELRMTQTTVGTFVSFDVPGATLGTAGVSINNGGVITGGYFTATPFEAIHGFVRARDGTFITFDPQSTMFGTWPVGLNDAGEITGQYGNPITSNTSGFLRQADGSIVTFDPPGSVNTNPTAINQAGVITGWYVDSNLFLHGFLRAKDGSITTFDAPGVGTGRFQGTVAQSLNPAGTITGSYTEINGLSHGFLRANDGTFTTFDVPGGPGALTGPPAAISPDDTITGSYFAANGIIGFVRDKNGVITSFTAPVPGSNPKGEFYTIPLGINPAGTVKVDLCASGAGQVRAGAQ
jgi:hypothetical protein